MIVIGLTGNIGTGKTTVCQILAKHGAKVVDADRLGHELLRPYTQTWRELVLTFSKSILKPDNEIDRRQLGEVVFNDPKALAKLNQILHPRMYQIAKERIEDWRKQGAKVVVLEAPLLIEAGWTSLVDQIWVTAAPEAVIVERLKKYKGLDEAQVLSRLHSQLPQEEKLSQADEIISTDCSLPELEARVEKLWQKVAAKDSV